MKSSSTLKKIRRSVASHNVFIHFSLVLGGIFLLVHWKLLKFQEESHIEILRGSRYSKDITMKDNHSENNSKRTPNDSYCKWDTFTWLEKVHRARMKHLKDACAKLKLERKLKTYGHFYVDDEHKLLICPVAKIGCSFWKAVLLITSKRVVERNPLDMLSGINSESFPQLNFDPPDVRKIKLDSYTKVIFTRDPLSRLYSAYQDKFVNFNEVYWGFGKMAVQLFRENATEKSLANGHDITFEEFLRLVVFNFETLGKVDSHWFTTEHACHPCDTDFDVIGRMETFDTDAKYVLCTSGMQNIIQLPDEDKTANILRNVRKDTYAAFQRKTALTNLIFTEREFLDRLVSNFLRHGYIRFPVSIPLNSTNEEALQILEKQIQLEARHSEKFRTATKDPFKNIPRDLLDKVMDLYKFDYELFGYERR
ncbi:unnamed protein product [Owenia fusiformis]|uniref:Carbohydrate sulfotransferase n=1 Tax=Owenia fusiformis TaxID=6347 RepID=A0A8J1Y371_OWEFU|nr:unnamed protein product [Owenia fusiformis]